MGDAFFRRLEGDRYALGEHARGPWSPEHAHGGPPSALLARALEEVAGGELLLARVQVQLWKPVPLGEVRVSAALERDGRTVKTLRAELASADGTLLASAVALGLREVPVSLPPLAAEPPPIPPPEACSELRFPFFGSAIGYHTAVELRLGGGGFGEGWAAGWLRMRIPLVEGEEPTPLQRVMVAADSGNGISLAVSTETHTFLNPDLTVTTHRPLEGAWVGMRSVTSLDGRGIGLADTLLFDARGPVGRGVQTLVVRNR